MMEAETEEASRNEPTQVETLASNILDIFFVSLRFDRRVMAIRLRPVGEKDSRQKKKQEKEKESTVNGSISFRTTSFVTVRPPRTGEEQRKSTKRVAREQSATAREQKQKKKETKKNPKRFIHGNGLISSVPRVVTSMKTSSRSIKRSLTDNRNWWVVTPVWVV